ncbi:hypothetical protein [Actinoplanes couchii]|uniref:Lipoprotein n=1 Tax=Actinoplanes couchii TaxID=403638 RepID=A0ABQ3XS43_9ACTN|nr:hypothetical protein [Actinoplanes couchii]MDR6323076.1 hypothetical protein [Actinoplanes couchii]GID61328.1 hypothetical protein Aco03nite_097320 [Actinoplanes couchii]
MRTPALVTVAIVTTFLTGCTSGPAAGGDVPAAGESRGGVVNATPAVGPGTSAAAAAEERTEAPTDAGLSADTEAICAQAGRSADGFEKTLAEDRELLAQVAGESAEAKARAKEKAARDVANFSYALLDMSELAGDPGLKKALAAMGAEVKGLDIAGLGGKRLQSLRSTLDKACGRG